MYLWGNYLEMEPWKHLNHSIEHLDASLDRLTQKKIELDGFRPIPPIVIKSIKETLTLEWTYNSNSIEGNTLTLQETKMVIEEGFTIKGKSLREHFEAVNHQEAIEYIESLAEPDYTLKERDILQAHYLVLQKIEKDFAGRYRTSGVRISGANFIPPNALKVTELMTELIQWVHEETEKLHPIVMASVFHHRFVHIHAFFDGNGRTVRLLFNLLLMKAGYPPAIILKNDRKKYYDALNKANEGDYGKLILLVMQAAERSLNIYLNALNNTDDYQPITNLVQEPGSRYGQEYISLLARTGKIDAYKEGRVWYTSEKAIQEYLNSRKRKRK